MSPNTESRFEYINFERQIELILNENMIHEYKEQKDVAESLLDSNDSSTSSPAYNEPVISGLRKKQ